MQAPGKELFWTTGDSGLLCSTRLSWSLAPSRRDQRARGLGLHYHSGASLECTHRTVLGKDGHVLIRIPGVLAFDLLAIRE